MRSCEIKIEIEATQGLVIVQQDHFRLILPTLLSQERNKTNPDQKAGIDKFDKIKDMKGEVVGEARGIILINMSQEAEEEENNSIMIEGEEEGAEEIGIKEIIITIAITVNVILIMHNSQSKELIETIMSKNKVEINHYGIRKKIHRSKIKAISS